MDGWPVLGPEPFSGEDLNAPVAPEELPGLWEIIRFDHVDGTPRVSSFETLTASSPLLAGKVYRCKDFENGGTVLALTGVDENGLAYWGKKKQEV